MSKEVSITVSNLHLHFHLEATNSNTNFHNRVLDIWTKDLKWCSSTNYTSIAKITLWTSWCSICFQQIQYEGMITLPCAVKTNMADHSYNTWRTSSNVVSYAMKLFWGSQTVTEHTRDTPSVMSSRRACCLWTTTKYFRNIRKASFIPIHLTK